MTTKRLKTKAVAREGINYVRRIVEAHNCIFHEIELENDLGNDAHIEFVVDEAATGCCIAVQIKSGSSYVSGTAKRLRFSSDRDHFEYWSSHALPVGAIVYDPVTKTAGWSDVTKHLSDHPESIIRGPYTISLPESQVFEEETFTDFRDYFLKYRDEYKRDSNFILALEKFADLDHPENCLTGIRSLFSFHRQRPITWYYMISCFSNFSNHALLQTLALILCHLPGHGDIWWGKSNVIDVEVREAALNYLKSIFGRDHIVDLLSCVDEAGFERGSLGQSIHAIIYAIPTHIDILFSIAFDPDLTFDIKWFALLLVIYEIQEDSSHQCLKVIDEYYRLFPSDPNIPMLREIRMTISKHGFVSFY